MADGLRAVLTAGVLLAAIPAGWVAARVAGAYWQRPVRYAAAMVIGATVLGFGWALAAMPAAPILAPTLLLAWTLIALTAVDLVSFRLPDALTLPLLTAGLGVSLFLPGGPILDHLAGAAAGYAVLALLKWGFERVRGREGIGLGDAKLLAAAGAWLGWSPLPSVLIIACAAAFAWVALTVLSRGRSAFRERLAFGGPLCLATWIVWTYGPISL
jgi:leader peptidase (prepilin peptidase)/N-methyltransferase